MKHVIVIETLDRYPMGELDKKYLPKMIEQYVDAHVCECTVLSAFDVQSAIGAVHKMFGAPEWIGGAE